MVAGPVEGKVGSFEELFVGILPRDVQLFEAWLCQLFDEHAVSRNHLFLGETGVKDEGVILGVKSYAISHVFEAWHL
jgi:hypothetical protein